MRKFSRQILIGALVMIFFTSGCGKLSLASPTPVWTATPAGEPLSPTVTVLPSATLVTGTFTPAIPITGENVVTLQCQFCVEAETHAVLLLPDSATFDVSSDTPVSCLTADVIDGRRILICHGTQSTTFYLNICSDPADCSLFSVALQPCPLLQAGATPVASNTLSAPLNLTPVGTRKAATKERKPPTGTPTPAATQATPTPAVNTPATPVPTSYSASSFVYAGK